MNNHRQKVLVTGASGFLGREVVDLLLETGNYEVFGLVGKSVKKALHEKPSAKNIYAADISDYSTLRDAEKNLRNVETVIHTAGLAHQFGRVSKEDFWKVNVSGTENVCRFALETGAERFVLISSVAVYGDHGKAEIDESFECRPESFYAESKLESEARAVDFCKANGMSLTILRPSTIIGEGDRGNTARLIKMVDKKRFVWIGEGENKKSLIYKTDVARGILKTVSAAKVSEREIYNLTSEAVSMREIVASVGDALQKRTSQFKISENFFRGIFRLNRTPFSFEYLRNIEKTFEKWLSDDIFSGKKFNREYDFKTETRISEALAKQVDYYLKHRN